MGARRRNYKTAKNAKAIREADYVSDTQCKDRADAIRSTDALAAALMREHDDRFAEPVPSTSTTVPRHFDRADVPTLQSSMGLV